MLPLESINDVFRTLKTGQVSRVRRAPLAPPRRGRFRLRAIGDFLRAELRDASDQLHGDGLGEREPDRALADLVRCKVVLERFDDGWCPSPE
jgi:hypothetical protein